MKGLKGQFVNRYAGSGVYGGTEYSFKTVLDDVAEGDLVVVDCSVGMAVVKVTEVSSRPGPKATRWAFQKVDADKLDMLERLESLREASIKKLNKKLSVRDAMREYRVLAEEDSEARILLEKLEEANAKLEI